MEKKRFIIDQILGIRKGVKILNFKFKNILQYSLYSNLYGVEWLLYFPAISQPLFELFKIDIFHIFRQ